MKFDIYKRLQAQYDHQTITVPAVKRLNSTSVLKEAES